MLQFFSFLCICFFALSVKQTGMQGEENVSHTCCYCQLTAEAREISKLGKPHVHCPCDKCNGRATWRMTAWRHLKSESEQSSQALPVKKTHKTLEELQSSSLELLVEHDEHEFEHACVSCFSDTYWRAVRLWLNRRIVYTDSGVLLSDLTTTVYDVL